MANSTSLWADGVVGTITFYSSDPDSLVENTIVPSGGNLIKFETPTLYLHDSRSYYNLGAIAFGDGGNDYGVSGNLVTVNSGSTSARMVTVIYTTHEGNQAYLDVDSYEASRPNDSSYVVQDRQVCFFKKKYPKN